MEYRVLLPVDGDEARAAAQARTAVRLPAAADNIVVTVLHAFPNQDPGKHAPVRALPSADRACEELEQHAVAVETMARYEQPAEAILVAADEIGADQIIMGGRKRSSLGSVLFGSVCQAVILEASLPVTVTGDTPPEDPTHICQSCGERYYTADGSTIDTCRACGGTKVEGHG